MGNRERWELYRRWVAANAIGEMAGLGATFLLIAFYSVYLGDQSSTAAILFAFLFAVASGAIEATLVSFLQWWAMHPWLPAVPRRSWWVGTLAGALAAYVLGYAPSTIMSMGQTGSQASVAEPPQVIVMLLAAGLGIAGGAMLSAGQWVVLRKSGIIGAATWIPANMLAWAAGMPMIFWAIDAAQKMPAVWQAILLVAAVLLVMGAVVGAIHGLFLLKIAAKNAPSRSSSVETALSFT